MNKQENYSEKLVDSILEGIFSTKGHEVVSLDLQSIHSTLCDYFIICHGDSNTQVASIANSIIKTVKENHGNTISHKEGYENSSWILLDFADVVVHIFHKSTRDYYNLEELWADAQITKFEDNMVTAN